MSFRPRVLLVLASVVALGSAVYPYDFYDRSAFPNFFNPSGFPSGLTNDVFPESQFEFMRELMSLQKPKTNETSDKSAFPSFFTGFEDFGFNPYYHKYPHFFRPPMSDVNSDRFNVFPFNFPGYNYYGQYPYYYPQTENQDTSDKSMIKPYNPFFYKYHKHLFGEDFFSRRQDSGSSDRTIFPNSWHRSNDLTRMLVEYFKKHPEALFNTKTGTADSSDRMLLPQEYPFGKRNHYKPYTPFYYQ